MSLFRYTRFGRERGPRIGSSLSGALAGAAIGGLAGLGACAWWLTGPPWLFPGDTIAAGALVVGWIGWRYGRDAVAAVREFGLYFPWCLLLPWCLSLPWR